MDQRTKEELLARIGREFLEKFIEKAPKCHYKSEMEVKNHLDSMTGNGNETHQIFLERDCSTIEINLSHGNRIIRERDMEEAAQDAMIHLSEAVDLMMERRKELTIHSSTIACIIAETKQINDYPWNAITRYLKRPIHARTGIKITPKGLIPPSPPEKIQWSVGRGGCSHLGAHEMRLPNKRILCNEFIISRKPEVLCDYSRVRIKGIDFPEAIITKSKGKPVDEIIEITGFRQAGITIKEMFNTSYNSMILLASPTVDMEGAFALAASILEAPRQ